MKKEVNEIERREEGSLFHVRVACIEKALSWGDDILMKNFARSLNLFNGLCVYLVVFVILLNNITYIMSDGVMPYVL